MTVKLHKPKEATWVNAMGDQVPLKFVPASDKKKELLATTIYKDAVIIEARLADLHKFMTDAFAQVHQSILDEYAIKGKEKKAGKGSLTWFNFDKSIKIEVDVNELSKWDEALMTEALALLNKYISSGMDEGKELIKELVTSAFATKRGMVDSKKVFQIIKFKNKTTNKTFLQACTLLEQAHSLDRTKSYMRVWEKTETGEYRNINLSFSSI